MGRPLIEIDPRQVEQLAGMHCTNEEIASVIGCSKDTIERRFAAVMQKGRANGKISLRRMIWQKCVDGNVTMMIFLSKQLLGYKDRIENDTNIVAENISHVVLKLPENGSEEKRSNETL